jgi:hypothetical protein
VLADPRLLLTDDLGDVGADQDRGGRAIDLGGW